MELDILNLFTQPFNQCLHAWWNEINSVTHYANISHTVAACGKQVILPN